jgi:hypothetical protein
MVDLRACPHLPSVPAAEEAMADLLYIVAALGAFALFALAVEACNRL